MIGVSMKKKIEEWESKKGRPTGRQLEQEFGAKPRRSSDFATCILHFIKDSKERIFIFWAIDIFKK